ncbi:MAG: phosphotransferase [Pseudobacteriovorax sp.]|nr:phosphotransferase [Pseudobacteriovorax sp.]
MEVENQNHRTSPMTSKKRLNALPPPPLKVLARHLDVDTITIEWLAGDGSDRCYYRLSSPQLIRTYVLMQLSSLDAKLLAENGYEWIIIGKILSQEGVRVPRTVATIPDYSALIIEDYGDTMLESRVQSHLQSNEQPSVIDLYKKVFPIIKTMLEIKNDNKSPWTKRSFDKDRFVWEMNFFYQNFLKPVANIDLSLQQQNDFKKESEDLSSYLATHSNYFVHRDLHSRNLMLQEGNVAMIDFQDARLGPASYDIVSLCFDSYVPLNQSFRIDLIKEFMAEMPSEIKQSLKSSWKPMLLQRQMKALGSFGYLSIVKQRGNYLTYLQPAMETLDETVFDSRWPFLSGQLIQIINKNLG